MSHADQRRPQSQGADGLHCDDTCRPLVAETSLNPHARDYGSTENMALHAANGQSGQNSAIADEISDKGKKEEDCSDGKKEDESLQGRCDERCLQSLKSRCLSVGTGGRQVCTEVSKGCRVLRKKTMDFSCRNCMRDTCTVENAKGKFPITKWLPKYK